MSRIRRCPYLGQGGDASAIRGYGAEQLHNEPLERREGLTAGVGAAFATFGLAVFMPRAAKSLPLADIEAGAVKPQDIVEEARVTVHVHPRRRHRHLRCWWHRGRRVCGWRQQRIPRTSGIGTKWISSTRALTFAFDPKQTFRGLLVASGFCFRISLEKTAGGPFGPPAFLFRFGYCPA
jgi:hypothetical protein